MPTFEKLFILALLGHLAGDFLIQPKSMALGKSNKGWEGFHHCTVHVILYTAVVFAWLYHPMTLRESIIVIASIAIPHWIIDRYSLASLWLRMIRGRTFEGVNTWQSRGMKFREWDIAFTAIVYTVTDMTLHLLCLLLPIYLMRGGL
jgi:hypothetical protein